MGTTTLEFASDRTVASACSVVNHSHCINGWKCWPIVFLWNPGVVIVRSIKQIREHLKSYVRHIIICLYELSQLRYIFLRQGMHLVVEIEQFIFTTIINISSYCVVIRERILTYRIFLFSLSLAHIPLSKLTFRTNSM